MGHVWRLSWVALAARIEGLRVGILFLLEANSGRTVAVDAIFNQFLRPAARDLLADMRGFLTAHGAFIGEPANALLEGRLGTIEGWGRDLSSAPQIISAVTALVALRAEFDAAIVDAELPRRALVDRAFAHLQRTIVADSEQRAKWQNAFSQGEAACEALGAVHLLLHGIWAFKVNSQGERTDLVLQDKLTVTSAIELMADAMVLTEWKHARGYADAVRKTAEARAQANLYAAGTLAASELRATRYIVIVTENPVSLPEDISDDQITYRHLNIATSPSVPSVRARALVRSK